MMNRVDKHGLVMKGLKAAAGYTVNLPGHRGAYVQISYDMDDGEILWNFHCSLGHNAWTEYDSPRIINVGFFDEPASMQDIADRIAEAVEEYKRGSSTLPN